MISQQLMASPSTQRSEDAELRAMRAFLLDKGTLLALDSDDEEKEEHEGSRSPVTSHATSDSSDSSSDHHPSEKEASVAPPEKTRPRQINRARVRMQKEMALLREQVTALNDRLAVIHTGAANAASTPPSTALVAWKTVAQDQRAQREAAEQERDHLRSLIKKNRRAMKYMRRIFRKRACPEAWAEIALWEPTPCRLLSPVSDVDAEFDTTSRLLENMYAQLDRVYEREPHMVSCLDGGMKLRVQNIMTASMTAELRESRIMPFDAAATARALWTCRNRRVANISEGIDEKAFEGDNVIRQSFSATILAPSYQGPIHGRTEARRFLLDDGGFAVLHCTRFQRTTRNEDDPEDQFGCQSINWTVVRPLHSHGPQRSACWVQMFEISTLFYLEPCEAPARISRQMCNLTLEGLEHVHTIEKQMVENSLLDMLNKA